MGGGRGGVNGRFLQGLGAGQRDGVGNDDFVSGGGLPHACLAQKHDVKVVIIIAPFSWWGFLWGGSHFVV